MKIPAHRLLESANEPEEAAYVSIRGVRLRLNELLDPQLSDVHYLNGLKARLQAASPFPHVVVDHWFDPRLLELVREEFDILPRRDWSSQFNAHARVERSRAYADMGPASRLYFSTLASSAFLRVLAHVSGVNDLMPDPHLFGGGLHETLPGGLFGVHTDFDRHPRTALHNEMVFITYLNKDWQPEWNGALELWDADRRSCVQKIEPEFGRSLLMLHGPTHFHGHSLPLAPPAGLTRRSVASYFYSNRFAREDRREAMLSTFLFGNGAERQKALAKQLLPPILVAALKRLAKRSAS